MKADRRHELRENSLTRAVRDGRAYLKQHGRKISWIVLAVALVVAVTMLFVQNYRRRHAELQQRFDGLLVRPVASRDATWLAKMQELAEQDDDERIAALACVKVGDAYRRRGRADDAPDADAAAQRYYRRVLSQYGDRTVAAGQARYGLGCLAEARGEAQAAADFYEQVTGDAALAGTAVAAMAEEAAAGLDDAAVEITMVARKPTTRTATRPTTGPATRPSPAATGSAATRPAEAQDAE
ncbi:MAG: hypothetical protein KGY99_02175 [Phycisphaerae bacterium]|nr:hypothetical protein [Phycisphaerae bacterium]